ncbi:hypothetical protein GLOIN_2v1788328 [Rhizophagus irregularis DAOM 181602=DAOM 197198]|uniref:Uncharacterized protein n=2 Tax=Rhizophagus irregularis TaxID=588596 RepID=A0A2P4P3Z3_RHIID|nr:hypothetical protein GLOIN_2v1788328 [Rhizophagus irregularis DAOM 181602=DAOM 197198]POG60090.1 hypothetical protein GLOIN_2v1788328 [Rhizophagus irregularis DAOM 181602=DAOM 197198]|eukprot:XP_025166956.1 hypothetical protein GLOIN_2v1788328 [Rhizophagus irregularis DAOM 181602=DAOM 197198]
MQINTPGHEGFNVNIDDNKLNSNSIEEDIKNLGGVIMKNQSKFMKYFQDGYKSKEEDNISIIAVITTTTELKKKRPLMEETTSSYPLELERKRPLIYEIDKDNKLNFSSWFEFTLTLLQKEILNILPSII